MPRSDDLNRLPDNLPVPVDDGACDHLPGMALPPVALQSTAGGSVRVDRLGPGAAVLYCYPRTGLPDQDPPGGLAAWDSIPGARGCTPQSCGYRDRNREIVAAGGKVFGLSTQTTDYQLEAATRLHLPFALLSDADLKFTRALRLPTFEVAGFTLIQRLTLLTRDGRIESVFYPVFPPDADAGRSLAWLRAAGGAE
ncbi:MAG TPA: peroxiredoxin [Candidatus Polarisedimenticolia bacterium]|nr:peroxiredoxin [Candidatus Polarisedimenticolia bacterium]